VGKRLKQLPGYLFKFNVMKKADPQSAKAPQPKMISSSGKKTVMILEFGFYANDNTGRFSKFHSWYVTWKSEDTLRLKLTENLVRPQGLSVRLSGCRKKFKRKRM